LTSRPISDYGDSDDVDYLAWQRAVGNGKRALTTRSAAVPEPATSPQFGLVAAAIFAMRRLKPRSTLR
jgi:hypothetical protein